LCSTPTATTSRLSPIANSPPGQPNGKRTLVQRSTSEILEWNPVEQVGQRPPLGPVCDHEPAAPVELARDVPEEAPHLLDAVAVARSARVRSIHEAPTWVKLADRRAVQVSVVALAKASVLPNFDREPVERDLRGLNGASQVGGEHTREPVVPASLTKRVCEAATFSRQLARKPPGRDATLVVDRGRMRLVDKVNGHSP
jgi:hypothetical protein